ncbi:atp synthase f1 subunit delta [Sutcliffiella horikoshii]|uniref:Atp synthase f1 subunit delta n=1 Tax=Sutcliffiella horikoshii TaxID=79883 RepID=A0ABM6KFA1_9BACI|nr:DUF4275 family protein [Sutcliffiella horikoshii]ART75058.1 atp synthase f1 subunit delta [Sutcliffiella horikoshii]
MKVRKEIRKELEVLETLNWGGYFRKSWEYNFAGHLSKEEKNAIYLDSFLWHLCSWEAVKCSTKGEAVRFFHAQEKDKCLIFYQHLDTVYKVENAKSLIVRDLLYNPSHLLYGDIYVMDWEKKWTFMMTHERECGPYFICT